MKATEIRSTCEYGPREPAYSWWFRVKMWFFYPEWKIR